MSSGTVLAFYNNKNNIPFIIIAADRLENWNYKTVVMHELGHHQSLRHTNIMDSIMYPSVDMGSNHITNYDLENFCRLYSCDAKELEKQ
jgi:hypothetical protein